MIHFWKSSCLDSESLKNYSTSVTLSSKMCNNICGIMQHLYVMVFSQLGLAQLAANVKNIKSEIPT